MKKRAFYKDIRRTLKNNLSRFIAITVMAALGIGVFSGFAAGCLDAFESANHFFQKQNTYDLQIVSTLGLTGGDLAAIAKVHGVGSLFGSRSMDVKVKQGNGNLLLANLNTLDSNGMNKPYVLRGTLPTHPGQVAVNSKFMEDTGQRLGDRITLAENITAGKASAGSGSPASALAVKQYTITAVILSPLNISNRKKGIASVSFSSGSGDYLMYATADCIRSSLYNTIYVTLEGASKFDGYSPEYQALVDHTVAVIGATIQKNRQRARYDEVVRAARAKLDKAEKLLGDKMSKAQQKLSDGQAVLNQNKSDYKAVIASARQKLADARGQIENIRMAKWYVWDRSDNNSIAGLKSDISFIQEVTRAFPIMFFLVAVLISLTTMTRMVEEDRGLIGTYKSLGYSNFQISMKYLFYALLACILGGLLGGVIGFIGLPKVIGIITGNLYALPKFELSFHLGYGLAGFGLFLLGITGATAFSCAEMLHQRPAELMRPKAPKAGSRILLERFPFIWKRLSFLNKVTCRNLFRYKKRAIMTIVGILGCTMLIVLAFGVKDSVGGLMTDQFGSITTYDGIAVTDHLNAKKMNTLGDEWRGSGKVKEELQLQISTLTLRSRSDSLNITVMVIPDGAELGQYIHLYDARTHKATILPPKGLVVTQNAAKKLALGSGTVVSLQNDEHIEHHFPVAFVASNYAGNYVYVRESCYQAAFGDYAPNAFLLKLVSTKDNQKWLKALREDKRLLSVSSSQAAREGFGDVNNLITLVVYLLVGMSAVLALTVLFTLSNINISERERELATIKVLGFQHEEMYSYVNRETLILTTLGILCGLPAGYAITYGILSSVSIADVAFKVRVSPLSYGIAASITLIFALLVNKITNKGLRNINMVEALKSVE